MNTTAQKYAPALLSFVVLVVGGLQAAVAAGPLTWVVLVQLAILTVTTGSTYLAPLVGEKWRGAFKTGLELVGVVLVLALPYVALGRITPAEVLLVVVAVIKAGAAQLGVVIRTDPTIAPAVMRGPAGPSGPQGPAGAMGAPGRDADRVPDGPDHRAGDVDYLGVPSSRDPEL